MLEELNEFEREVLKNLPIEPMGFSVEELAEELLGATDEQSRRKVISALLTIAEAIDGLWIAHTNDRRQTALFGIPRQMRQQVMNFFDSTCKRT